MHKMFFHPNYAWSLIDDLWTDRIIPEDHIRGYAERQIYKLRQSRIISDEAKSIARQMFVFAEGVILPGEVDFSDLMATEFYEKNVITWGNDILGDEQVTLDPAFIDLTTDKAAKLLPYLRNQELGVSDIERVLDYWDRYRRFEEFAVETFGSENRYMMLQCVGLRDDIAKGKHEQNQFWKNYLPRRNGLY